MEIRRIAASSQPPSAGRQAEARADRPPTELVRVEPPARARVYVMRAAQGFRPVAGFLAQYVGQHAPGSPSLARKEGKRRRATRAYIEADMLPDLLAETLRLGTIDRKL